MRFKDYINEMDTHRMSDRDRSFVGHQEEMIKNKQSSSHQNKVHQYDLLREKLHKIGVQLYPGSDGMAVNLKTNEIQKIKEVKSILNASGHKHETMGDDKNISFIIQYKN